MLCLCWLRIRLPRLGAVGYAENVEHTVLNHRHLVSRDYSILSCFARLWRPHNI